MIFPPDLVGVRAPIRAPALLTELKIAVRRPRRIIAGRPCRRINRGEIRRRVHL